MAEALVRAAQRPHEREPRCAGVLQEQPLQKAHSDHRPQRVRSAEALRAQLHQEGISE